MDPVEGARALREVDGTYIGNRPCKLRKSTWAERGVEGGGGRGGKLPDARALRRHSVLLAHPKKQ